MKLLDKDVLVAEIERRIERYSKLQGNGATEVGRIFGMLVEELTEFLSFVNTLEVKEVDLEKELEDWIGDRVGKWTGKECERMCRYFFELGLKAQKGE